MRILIVSPYLPWPLHHGTALRIFNQIRQLSSRGHRVVLIAGHGSPSSVEMNPLNSLCEELHLYPVSTSSRYSVALRSLYSFHPYPMARYGFAQLRRKVDDLSRNGDFDIIWVNQLIMTEALPTNVNSSVVVLDRPEDEEVLWRRYALQGSPAQRLFAWLNLLKVRRFERQISSKFDVTFCVSEQESAQLRERVRGIEVWTVPNGMDEEYFSVLPTDGEGSNVILLCGNMGVERNIHAARWFARDIFANIRRAVPESEFWIVGADPGREVRRLGLMPGVRVTGTVEDVRPYYSKAGVVIAPYRFGEGTKLKVLEAMAMGKPIVSTSIGCQGIDVVDGRDMLIVDNQDAFADAVVGLLWDKNKAQVLGGAARALIEQKYTWNRIVDTLEPRLREITRQRRSETGRDQP